MTRAIQLINQSSVTDAELKAFLQDMYTATTIFQNAWNISSYVSMGTGWPVTLLDEPGPDDPPDALGYHDIDSNFVPYARCFIMLAEQQGVPWSVVVSHEIFEMLADPRVNATTFVDSGSGKSGYLIYEEVADPVEMQYSKGDAGVAISNFVYPEWYIPGYTGQVDNLNLLAGPLRIASGGYGSYDVILYASGWLSATKTGTRRVQKIIQRS